MLRRVVDIFSALVCLILVSPIVVVTTVAVYLTDRGPIVYRQQRAGLLGKPFTVFKFRSMRLNDLAYDDVTEIRTGHPLVTPIGNLIRRYKIDELPQMLNVLRGEMSLIGPRPTIPDQVERYTEFQKRRLEIPPGLTGWAQVNGGVDLTWPERIMLDVWYVDHRSLWLDAEILAKTVCVVLFGERLNEQARRQATEYAQHWIDAAQSNGLLAAKTEAKREDSIR